MNRGGGETTAARPSFRPPPFRPYSEKTTVRERKEEESPTAGRKGIFPPLFLAKEAHLWWLFSLSSLVYCQEDEEEEDEAVAAAHLFGLRTPPLFPPSLRHRKRVFWCGGATTFSLRPPHSPPVSCSLESRAAATADGFGGSGVEDWLSRRRGRRAERRRRTFPAKGSFFPKRKGQKENSSFFLVRKYRVQIFPPWVRLWASPTTSSRRWRGKRTGRSGSRSTRSGRRRR